MDSSPPLPARVPTPPFPSSSQAEHLFQGLPPPLPPPPSPPPPPPPPSQPAELAAKRRLPRRDGSHGGEGPKRVRFKMSVEASTDQVITAMKKITAHIGNPAKFSKASKLALQLLQAGSVTKDTVDSYYEILRTSMASPPLATEATLRGDYHELFFAVNEHLDCFNSAQQAQLEVWFLWALAANDLFTDDTFVFSKAAAKVRQHISSLSKATEAEDAAEEASAIHQMGSPNNESMHQAVDVFASANSHVTENPENDPFGLNIILPTFSKKEERAKKRKEEEVAIKKAQENIERQLREQREALMKCLNIAASRYKIQWAQTIIDILVKHAFDNISRFTTQQRNAIEKLWTSIREQQVRRKQGKTTSGKLDVTAFERLQEKYANEKISIRHAVGASGDRTAEQWLG